ncbi:DUF397 domain-containing protein [Streptomyces sp. NPDC058464]|uniref:DUF397 domain-containing protein n=1 Tax=Streptomyces sp. NPDC058464 TaxID=3346511 RepID=UPI0036599AC9
MPCRSFCVFRCPLRDGQRAWNTALSHVIRSLILFCAIDGDPGGAVIRPGDNWKKSSYSETNACVEVAFRASVRVRDSKQSSPTFVEFSTPAWRFFVGACQAEPSLRRRVD